MSAERKSIYTELMSVDTAASSAKQLTMIEKFKKKGWV